MINPSEPDQVWRNCHQTWIHYVSAMILLLYIYCYPIRLPDFDFKDTRLQAFVVTSWPSRFSTESASVATCGAVSGSHDGSQADWAITAVPRASATTAILCRWDAKWKRLGAAFETSVLHRFPAGFLDSFRITPTASGEIHCGAQKESRVTEGCEQTWCLAAGGMVFFAYRNCWMDLCWVWGWAFPVIHPWHIEYSHQPVHLVSCFWVSPVDQPTPTHYRFCKKEHADWSIHQREGFWKSTFLSIPISCVDCGDAVSACHWWQCFASFVPLSGCHDVYNMTTILLFAGCLRIKGPTNALQSCQFNGISSEFTINQHLRKGSSWI